MSTSVRPHRRPPTRLPHPWDSPGKNTGVGCHFLLQCVKVKSLSPIGLLATAWTAAYQAPPSIGFSRQEYWSGVPLPSPHLLFDQFQFALIHGPNIPGCYAVLLFKALDFTSTTKLSHPPLGVVFALVLSLHSFWSYFSTDLW